MGYIEELAAREAARQEANRGKQFEAGRVLNQGNPGLAAMAVDPYVRDLSLEDEYKLELAKRAEELKAKAAYDKLAANRLNASKQYVEDSKTLKRTGWDTPEGYEAIVRSEAFEDKVDPGLAAKWIADREYFR